MACHPKKRAMSIADFSPNYKKKRSSSMKGSTDSARQRLHLLTSQPNHHPARNQKVLAFPIDLSDCLNDASDWEAMEIRFLDKNKCTVLRPKYCRSGSVDGRCSRSCSFKGSGSVSDRPSDETSSTGASIRKQTVCVEKLHITNLLHTKREKYGNVGSSRLSEYTPNEKTIGTDSSVATSEDVTKDVRQAAEYFRSPKKTEDASVTISNHSVVGDGNRKAINRTDEVEEYGDKAPSSSEDVTIDDSDDEKEKEYEDEECSDDSSSEEDEIDEYLDDDNDNDDESDNSDNFDNDDEEEEEDDDDDDEEEDETDENADKSEENPEEFVEEEHDSKDETEITIVKASSAEHFGRSGKDGRYGTNTERFHHKRQHSLSSTTQATAGSASHKRKGSLPGSEENLKQTNIAGSSNDAYKHVRTCEAIREDLDRYYLAEEFAHGKINEASKSCTESNYRKKERVSHGRNTPSDCYGHKNATRYDLANTQKESNAHHDSRDVNMKGTVKGSEIEMDDSFCSSVTKKAKSNLLSSKVLSEDEVACYKQIAFQILMARKMQGLNASQISAVNQLGSSKKSTESSPQLNGRRKRLLGCKKSHKNYRLKKSERAVSDLSSNSKTLNSDRYRFWAPLRIKHQIEKHRKRLSKAKNTSDDNAREMPVAPRTASITDRSLKSNGAKENKPKDPNSSLELSVITSLNSSKALKQLSTASSRSGDIKGQNTRSQASIIESYGHKQHSETSSAALRTAWKLIEVGSKSQLSQIQNTSHIPQYVPYLPKSPDGQSQEKMNNAGSERNQINKNSETVENAKAANATEENVLTKNSKEDEANVEIAKSCRKMSSTACSKCHTQPAAYSTSIIKNIPRNKSSHKICGPALSYDKNKKLFDKFKCQTPSEAHTGPSQNSLGEAGEGESVDPTREQQRSKDSAVQVDISLEKLLFWHRSIGNSSMETSKTEKAERYLDILRNVLRSPTARAAQALGAFLQKPEAVKDSECENKMTVDQIIRSYQAILDELNWIHPKDPPQQPVKDNSLQEQRQQQQQRSTPPAINRRSPSLTNKPSVNGDENKWWKTKPGHRQVQVRRGKSVVEPGPSSRQKVDCRCDEPSHNAYSLPSGKNSEQNKSRYDLERTKKHPLNGSSRSMINNVENKDTALLPAGMADTKQTKPGTELRKKEYSRLSLIVGPRDQHRVFSGPAKKSIPQQRQQQTADRDLKFSVENEPFTMADEDKTITEQQWLNHRFKIDEIRSKLLDPRTNWRFRGGSGIKPYISAPVLPFSSSAMRNVPRYQLHTNSSKQKVNVSASSGHVPKTAVGNVIKPSVSCQYNLERGTVLASGSQLDPLILSHLLTSSGAFDVPVSDLRFPGDRTRQRSFLSSRQRQQTKEAYSEYAIGAKQCNSEENSVASFMRANNDFSSFGRAGKPAISKSQPRMLKNSKLSRCVGGKAISKEGGSIVPSGQEATTRVDESQLTGGTTSGRSERFLHGFRAPNIADKAPETISMLQECPSITIIAPQACLSISKAKDSWKPPTSTTKLTGELTTPARPFSANQKTHNISSDVRNKPNLSTAVGSQNIAMFSFPHNGMHKWYCRARSLEQRRGPIAEQSVGSFINPSERKKPFICHREKHNSASMCVGQQWTHLECVSSSQANSNFAIQATGKNNEQQLPRPETSRSPKHFTGASKDENSTHFQHLKGDRPTDSDMSTSVVSSEVTQQHRPLRAPKEDQQAIGRRKNICPTVRTPAKKLCSFPTGQLSKKGMMSPRLRHFTAEKQQEERKDELKAKVSLSQNDAPRMRSFSTMQLPCAKRSSSAKAESLRSQYALQNKKRYFGYTNYQTRSRSPSATHCLDRVGCKTNKSSSTSDFKVVVCREPITRWRNKDNDYATRDIVPPPRARKSAASYMGNKESNTRMRDHTSPIISGPDGPNPAKPNPCSSEQTLGSRKKVENVGVESAAGIVVGSTAAKGQGSGNDGRGGHSKEGNDVARVHSKGRSRSVEFMGKKLQQGQRIPLHPVKLDKRGIEVPGRCPAFTAVGVYRSETELRHGNSKPEATKYSDNKNVMPIRFKDGVNFSASDKIRGSVEKNHPGEIGDRSTDAITETTTSLKGTSAAHDQCKQDAIKIDNITFDMNMKDSPLVKPPESDESGTSEAESLLALRKNTVANTCEMILRQSRNTILNGDSRQSCDDSTGKTVAENKSPIKQMVLLCEQKRPNDFEDAGPKIANTAHPSPPHVNSESAHQSYLPQWVGEKARLVKKPPVRACSFNASKTAGKGENDEDTTSGSSRKSSLSPKHPELLATTKADRYVDEIKSEDLQSNVESLNTKLPDREKTSTFLINKPVTCGTTQSNRNHRNPKLNDQSDRAQLKIDEGCLGLHANKDIMYGRTRMKTSKQAKKPACRDSFALTPCIDLSRIPVASFCKEMRQKIGTKSIEIGETETLRTQSQQAVSGAQKEMQSIESHLPLKAITSSDTSREGLNVAKQENRAFKGKAAFKSRTPANGDAAVSDKCGCHGIQLPNLVQYVPQIQRPRCSIESVKNDPELEIREEEPKTVSPAEAAKRASSSNKTHDHSDNLSVIYSDHDRSISSQEDIDSMNAFPSFEDAAHKHSDCVPVDPSQIACLNSRREVQDAAKTYLSRAECEKARAFNETAPGSGHEKIDSEDGTFHSDVTLARKDMSPLVSRSPLQKGSENPEKNLANRLEASKPHRTHYINSISSLTGQTSSKGQTCKEIPEQPATDQNSGKCIATSCQSWNIKCVDTMNHLPVIGRSGLEHLKVNNSRSSTFKVAGRKPKMASELTSVAKSLDKEKGLSILDGQIEITPRVHNDELKSFSGGKSVTKGLFNATGRQSSQAKPMSERTTTCGTSAEIPNAAIAGDACQDKYRVQEESDCSSAIEISSLMSAISETSQKTLPAIIPPLEMNIDSHKENSREIRLNGSPHVHQQGKAVTLDRSSPQETEVSSGQCQINIPSREKIASISSGLLGGLNDVPTTPLIFVVTLKPNDSPVGIDLGRCQGFPVDALLSPGDMDGTSCQNLPFGILMSPKKTSQTQCPNTPEVAHKKTSPMEMTRCKKLPVCTMFSKDGGATKFFETNSRVSENIESDGDNLKKPLPSDDSPRKTSRGMEETLVCGRTVCFSKMTELTNNKMTHSSGHVITSGQPQQIGQMEINPQARKQCSPLERESSANPLGNAFRKRVTENEYSDHSSQQYSDAMEEPEALNKATVYVDDTKKELITVCEQPRRKEAAPTVKENKTEGCITEKAIDHHLPGMIVKKCTPPLNSLRYSEESVSRAHDSEERLDVQVGISKSGMVRDDGTTGSSSVFSPATTAVTLPHKQNNFEVGGEEEDGDVANKHELVSMETSGAICISHIKRKRSIEKKKNVCNKNQVEVVGTGVKVEISAESCGPEKKRFAPENNIVLEHNSQTRNSISDLLDKQTETNNEDHDFPKSNTQVTSTCKRPQAKPRSCTRFNFVSSKGTDLANQVPELPSSKASIRPVPGLLHGEGHQAIDEENACKHISIDEVHRLMELVEAEGQSATQKQINGCQCSHLPGKKPGWDKPSPLNLLNRIPQTAECEDDQDVSLQNSNYSNDGDATQSECDEGNIKDCINAQNAENQAEPTEEGTESVGNKTSQQNNPSQAPYRVLTRNSAKSSYIQQKAMENLELFLKSVHKYYIPSLSHLQSPPKQIIGMEKFASSTRARSLPEPTTLKRDSWNSTPSLFSDSETHNPAPFEFSYPNMSTFEEEAIGPHSVFSLICMNEEDERDRRRATQDAMSSSKSRNKATAVVGNPLTSGFPPVVSSACAQQICFKKTAAETANSSCSLYSAQQQRGNPFFSQHGCIGTRHTTPADSGNQLCYRESDTTATNDQPNFRRQINTHFMAPLTGEESVKTIATSRAGALGSQDLQEWGNKPFTLTKEEIASFVDDNNPSRLGINVLGLDVPFPRDKASGEAKEKTSSEEENLIIFNDTIPCITSKEQDNSGDNGRLITADDLFSLDSTARGNATPPEFPTVPGAPLLDITILESEWVPDQNKLPHAASCNQILFSPQDSDITFRSNHNALNSAKFFPLEMLPMKSPQLRIPSSDTPSLFIQLDEELLLGIRPVNSPSLKTVPAEPCPSVIQSAMSAPLEIQPCGPVLIAIQSAPSPLLQHPPAEMKPPIVQPSDMASSLIKGDEEASVSAGQPAEIHFPVKQPAEMNPAILQSADALPAKDPCEEKNGLPIQLEEPISPLKTQPPEVSLLIAQLAGMCSFKTQVCSASPLTVQPKESPVLEQLDENYPVVIQTAETSPLKKQPPVVLPLITQRAEVLTPTMEQAKKSSGNLQPAEISSLPIQPARASPLPKHKCEKMDLNSRIFELLGSRFSDENVSERDAQGNEDEKEKEMPYDRVKNYLTEDSRNEFSNYVRPDSTNNSISTSLESYSSLYAPTYSRSNTDECIPLNSSSSLSVCCSSLECISSASKNSRTSSLSWSTRFPKKESRPSSRRSRVHPMERKELQEYILKTFTSMTSQFLNMFNGLDKSFNMPPRICFSPTKSRSVIKRLKQGRYRASKMAVRHHSHCSSKNQVHFRGINKFGNGTCREIPKLSDSRRTSDTEYKPGKNKEETPAISPWETIKLKDFETSTTTSSDEFILLESRDACMQNKHLHCSAKEHSKISLEPQLGRNSHSKYTRLPLPSGIACPISDQASLQPCLHGAEGDADDGKVEPTVSPEGTIVKTDKGPRGSKESPTASVYTETCYYQRNEAYTSEDIILSPLPELIDNMNEETYNVLPSLPIFPTVIVLAGDICVVPLGPKDATFDRPTKFGGSAQFNHMPEFSERKWQQTADTQKSRSNSFKDELPQCITKGFRTLQEEQVLERAQALDQKKARAISREDNKKSIPSEDQSDIVFQTKIYEQDYDGGIHELVFLTSDFDGVRGTGLVNPLEQECRESMATKKTQRHPLVFCRRNEGLTPQTSTPLKSQCNFALCNEINSSPERRRCESPNHCQSDDDRNDLGAPQINFVNAEDAPFGRRGCGLKARCRFSHPVNSVNVPQLQHVHSGRKSYSMFIDEEETYNQNMLAETNQNMEKSDQHGVDGLFKDAAYVWMPQAKTSSFRGHDERVSNFLVDSTPLSELLSEFNEPAESESSVRLACEHIDPCHEIFDDYEPDTYEELVSLYTELQDTTSSKYLQADISRTHSLSDASVSFSDKLFNDTSSPPGKSTSEISAKDVGNRTTGQYPPVRSTELFDGVNSPSNDFDTLVEYFYGNVKNPFASPKNEDSPQLASNVKSCCTQTDNLIGTVSNQFSRKPEAAQRREQIREWMSRRITSRNFKCYVKNIVDNSVRKRLNKISPEIYASRIRQRKLTNPNPFRATNSRQQVTNDSATAWNSTARNKLSRLFPFEKENIDELGSYDSNRIDFFPDPFQLERLVNSAKSPSANAESFLKRQPVKIDAAEITDTLGNTSRPNQKARLGKSSSKVDSARSADMRFDSNSGASSSLSLVRDSRNPPPTMVDLPNMIAHGTTALPCCASAGTSGNDLKDIGERFKTQLGTILVSGQSESSLPPATTWLGPSLGSTLDPDQDAQPHQKQQTSFEGITKAQARSQQPLDTNERKQDVTRRSDYYIDVEHWPERFVPRLWEQTSSSSHMTTGQDGGAKKICHKLNPPFIDKQFSEQLKSSDFLPETKNHQKTAPSSNKSQFVRPEDLDQKPEFAKMDPSAGYTEEITPKITDGSHYSSGVQRIAIQEERNKDMYSAATPPSDQVKIIELEKCPFSGASAPSKDGDCNGCLAVCHRSSTFYESANTETTSDIYSYNDAKSQKICDKSSSSSTKCDYGRLKDVLSTESKMIWKNLTRLEQSCERCKTCRKRYNAIIELKNVIGNEHSVLNSEGSITAECRRFPEINPRDATLEKSSVLLKDIRCAGGNINDEDFGPKENNKNAMESLELKSDMEGEPSQTHSIYLAGDPLSRVCLDVRETYSSDDFLSRTLVHSPRIAIVGDGDRIPERGTSVEPSCETLDILMKEGNQHRENSSVCHSGMEFLIVDDNKDFFRNEETELEFQPGKRNQTFEVAKSDLELLRLDSAVSNPSSNEYSETRVDPEDSSPTNDPLGHDKTCAPSNIKSQFQYFVVEGPSLIDNKASRSITMNEHLSLAIYDGSDSTLSPPVSWQDISAYEYEGKHYTSPVMASSADAKDSNARTNIWIESLVKILHEMHQIFPETSQPESYTSSNSQYGETYRAAGNSRISGTRHINNLESPARLSVLHSNNMDVQFLETASSKEGERSPPIQCPAFSNYPTCSKREKKHAVGIKSSDLQQSQDCHSEQTVSIDSESLTVQELKINFSPPKNIQNDSSGNNTSLALVNKSLAEDDVEATENDMTFVQYSPMSYYGLPAANICRDNCLRAAEYVSSNSARTTFDDNKHVITRQKGRKIKPHVDLMDSGQKKPTRPPNVCQHHLGELESRATRRKSKASPLTWQGVGTQNPVSGKIRDEAQSHCTSPDPCQCDIVDKRSLAPSREFGQLKISKDSLHYNKLNRARAEPFASTALRSARRVPAGKSMSTSNVGQEKFLNKSFNAPVVPDNLNEIRMKSSKESEEEVQCGQMIIKYNGTTRMISRETLENKEEHAGESKIESLSPHINENISEEAVALKPLGLSSKDNEYGHTDTIEYIKRAANPSSDYCTDSDHCHSKTTCTGHFVCYRTDSSNYGISKGDKDPLGSSEVCPDQHGIQSKELCVPCVQEHSNVITLLVNGLDQSTIDLLQGSIPLTQYEELNSISSDFRSDSHAQPISLVMNVESFIRRSENSVRFEKSPLETKSSFLTNSDREPSTSQAECSKDLTSCILPTPTSVQRSYNAGGTVMRPKVSGHKSVPANVRITRHHKEYFAQRDVSPLRAMNTLWKNQPPQFFYFSQRRSGHTFCEHQDEKGEAEPRENIRCYKHPRPSSADSKKPTVHTADRTKAQACNSAGATFAEPRSLVQQLEIPVDIYTVPMRKGVSPHRWRKKKDEAPTRKIVISGPVRNMSMPVHRHTVPQNDEASGTRATWEGGNDYRRPVAGPSRPVAAGRNDDHHTATSAGHSSNKQTPKWRLGIRRIFPFGKRVTSPDHKITQQRHS